MPESRRPAAALRALRKSMAVAAAGVALGCVAVVAAPAGATPPTPPPHELLPRFAMFGWVSPPVEFTSPERLGEMAALGFDVVLPTQDDEGVPADNLARLDAAAAHGMRALVYDRRFLNAYYAGITTPEAGAVFDSIVASYRFHPGLLGYYLGDEPRGAWIDTIAMFHRELQKRDPRHITWNNLLGVSSFVDDSAFRAYVNGYLERVPAAVLCDAHYDFTVTGDRNRFFENVTAMRALADAHGLPFWVVVQLTPHLVFRPLTEGELRWQVSQLLAFGTRGIGYFTYWAPRPDSTLNWGPAVIARDGTRTPWYDVLAAFDARVRPAGERLAGMRWLSAQATAPAPAGVAPFVGDDWLAGVDGHATVGRFVDPGGTPWVLVANRDSLDSRTVVLGLRGATGATRMDGGAPVTTNTDLGATFVHVPLEAGDFALLRIDGTLGEAGVTLGPVVLPTVNPARGIVRVGLERIGGGARFDVMDALGRRVWSTPLAAGANTVAWDGRDTHGARVAAGLYLMRVRAARGASSRRLAWLGP